jgi:serine/threonine-protein kinase
LDTPRQPSLGDLVAGRYRLVLSTGEDGYCRYFRADDNATGERVSVGFLKVQYSGEPELAERFLNWARHSAGLRDPGMLQILDAGQSEFGPFMVAEALDDTPLSNYIAGSAPFATRDVVTILRQVATTLDYMHGRGIVDGALSSDRILVNHQGHTRIVNPGLAVALTPQTEAGSLDSRADVYLLGSLVYEMLTGSVPDPDQAPVSVASQRLDSSATAAIDEVISRAMDPIAARRYPTPAAFSQAFESTIAGLGTDEPSAPQPAPADETTQRRPAVVAPPAP